MTSYLIKKMVSLAAVLFLVSLTVFSVLFVLPGDPAQIILGINASPETLAALRARLGLDQPFWAQYGSWIGSLLQGTGGHSITYDMAVFELIGSRLAVTGPLALMAMAIAVVLALPLGDLCRPPSEPPRRCRRDGRYPAGTGGARILAGHPADAAFFRSLGNFQCRRFSRLG